MTTIVTPAAPSLAARFRRSLGELLITFMDSGATEAPSTRHDRGDWAVGRARTRGDNRIGSTDGSAMRDAVALPWDCRYGPPPFAAPYRHSHRETPANDDDVPGPQVDLRCSDRNPPSKGCSNTVHSQSDSTVLPPLIGAYASVETSFDLRAKLQSSDVET